jgi:FkbM family methyltransferase
VVQGSFGDAGLRLLRPLARAHARSRFLKRATKLAARPLLRRDSTIRTGVGAGLRFNAGGANVGYVFGTTEPLVQRLLASRLRPGGVVFDIGANVGFFTVIAARLVGPEGRIFAFEPLPEAIPILRRNAALNGMSSVEVIEAAVGAADGQGTLRIPDLLLGARLDDSASDGDRQVVVQITSIDSALARGEIVPPDFVKIDAEGAEGDVLRGMAKTIRAHRPEILCELHETAAIVLPLLESFGYAVDYVEPDAKPGAEYWACHIFAAAAL